MVWFKYRTIVDVTSNNNNNKKFNMFMWKRGMCFYFTQFLWTHHKKYFSLVINVLIFKHFRKKLELFKTEFLKKKQYMYIYIFSNGIIFLQKWSQELATIARNYAQKCQFAHNTQRSSQSSTFSYVGENLYIGPGK